MVFSLALGWTMIYMNRTCLYPLLPLIATALGVTSAQAGLLSGVYFAFYVAMQIPGGFLMDRFGTKKCLVAGYVLSGLALLCLGIFGGSYGTLLFFLGVQGLGDGFYYSGAQTSVIAHVPANKKSFCSALLGVGMSTGVLLGLGLSHPLYTYFEGYRLPFFLLGLSTLLVAATLARFVPDVRSPAKTDVRDFIALFKDADIWKIGLATFGLMYGFWVILNWGPTFLKMERGFVPEQAGFYSGLVAFAAIPGGIVWSRLADRWGRKAVLATVLPLSAVFLFAVATVGSFPRMVLSLLAFGFCTNSAVVPVAVVWVSQIANERYPGKTAVVIAFFNCLIIASAVVAPILSGFIRDVTGSLAGSILVGSGAVLLGFPLILRARSEQLKPTVIANLN